MSIHGGSWNAYLLEFELGERRYVETTLEGYPTAMRTMNVPMSRRPSALQQCRFKTELFTAVSATQTMSRPMLDAIKALGWAVNVQQEIRSI